MGEWIDTHTRECCFNRTYDKATESCCEGLEVYKPSIQTCCADYSYLPSFVKHKVVAGRGECCKLTDVYDPDTQVCCGDGDQGVVQSRYDGLNEKTCCGLKTYNNDNEMCCNKEVVAYEAGQECCGIVAYSPDTELCCDNKRLSKENGMTDCCRNISYNRETHQCFTSTPQGVYDKHVAICYNTAYNSYKDGCCIVDIEKKRYGRIAQGIPEKNAVKKCCGLDSYLDNTHICCNDHLYERSSPDVRCCDHGEEIYNTVTDLCCSGKRHVKWANDTECCGENTYNSSTHICCDNNMVISRVNGDQCCGDSLYWLATDTCCMGYGYGNQGIFQTNIYPNQIGKCCGYQIYNDSLSICDNDNIYKKNHSNDDSVCHQYNVERTVMTYDSNEKKCTDGAVTLIRHDNNRLVCAGEIYDHFNEYNQERHCCEGGSTQAYFPDIQSCCGGSVFPIPLVYSKCCGTTAYDNRTQICAGSQVCDKIDNQTIPKSCGGHCYNPNHQSCCFGELIGPGQTCCKNGVYQTPGTPLGSKDCCNSVGYNAETEICCGGSKLYAKNSTDLICCGEHLKNMNDDMTVCCDGKLLSTEHNRTLCTGQVSHNSTETVCEGIRYPVHDGVCCGEYILNTEQEVCCENNRYPKEKDMECCGTILFNSTEDSCCKTSSEFIYKKSQPSMCCDVENYDNTKGTCCGGIWYTDVLAGECCGPRIIRNPSEETCCGGRIHTRDILYNFPQICCSGVMKYAQHGDHSICCEGNVIDSSQTSCCNGELMIKERQRCCGGTIQNLAHGNEQCCNDRPYNSRLDACCDNSIINLSNATCVVETSTIVATETTDVPEINNAETSQTSELSNDIAIIVQPCASNETHGCCSGLPFNKSERGCCDGTIYLTTESTCCGSSVCDLSKGTECCEERNYNPDEQICCLGKLRKNKKHTACCRSRTFNYTSQFCCKGVPIPLNKLTPKWSEHCCPAGQAISNLTRTCKEPAHSAPIVP
ncbi:uncharacterized protein [Antedon mediterranea]|uniref:uncharacterized protein isoform X2 n=1 Tax=Antedon mediterranea TaxID=105859 RepID=UPI003AF5CD43